MKLIPQTVYIPIPMQESSPSTFTITSKVRGYIHLKQEVEKYVLSKEELIELFRTIYFGGIEGYIVKDGGFDGWLQTTYPELNINS